MVDWDYREEGRVHIALRFGSSRGRLDFHLLDGGGVAVEIGSAPSDADGVRGLTERLGRLQV